MPWARLDDGLNDDAKLNALSSEAFRLWVRGLVYCQKNLTDGFIPECEVARWIAVIRERDRQKVVGELCRALEYLGKGPLWNPRDGGYEVHDYLQWNDSREQVELARLTAKQRMALFQNPKLRADIRARDGDRCRYCGRIVRWNDRKGDLGGTYDHVQPYAGNAASNLVVCCRGCNASKRGRTPEQAGMTLLELPSEKKLGLVPRSHLDISESELSLVFEWQQDQQQATTYHVPQVTVPSEVLAPEKQERADASSSESTQERIDRLNTAIRQHRRRRSQETTDGRPAVPVVAALARDILRQHPNETDDFELRALLKDACAKANLLYDSATVGEALDQAKAQLRRAQ